MSVYATNRGSLAPFIACMRPAALAIGLAAGMRRKGLFSVSERERGQCRAYMPIHDSCICVASIDTRDTIRYVHERPLKRIPHYR